MEKQTVVYTGGTFDLFHRGHVNLLKKCKEIGDIVVVSLNTDEFIEEYKGNPPVIDYESRRVVLESCRYVDKVVPNIGGKDSKPAILNVKPNYIVIGDDWLNKDYHKQMGFTQDWLDENRIELIYIKYTDGISSTKIKTKLK